MRRRESLPSPTHTIFHLASRTVSYAYVTLSRHWTHSRRVSHAAVAIVQVQSPTRDATLLLLLQVPPYDAAYYPTLYHIYIGRERQWRGATGTALVVCQAPAENTSPTHPFSGQGWSQSLSVCPRGPRDRCVSGCIHCDGVLPCCLAFWLGRWDATGGSAAPCAPLLPPDGWWLTCCHARCHAASPLGLADGLSRAARLRLARPCFSLMAVAFPPPATCGGRGGPMVGSHEGSP